MGVCADTGVVGGFIGTVRYNERDYSTGEGGNFEAVSGYDSASSGAMVYTANGECGWGSRVVDEIADDAYWAWDGSINNVITFQFDFGNLYVAEAEQRQAFVEESSTSFGVAVMDSSNVYVLAVEMIGVVLMFVAAVHMFTRKAEEKEYEPFE